MSETSYFEYNCLDDQILQLIPRFDVLGDFIFRNYVGIYDEFAWFIHTVGHFTDHLATYCILDGTVERFFE